MRKAQALRLAPVEALGGEQEPPRCGGTDPAHDHRRDLRRRNTQSDFGQRETRIRRGQHHVGQAGDAQTAGHGDTLNGDDKQLRQFADGAQGAAKIGAEAHDVLARAALEHLAEHLQIAARTEGAALAAQHDTAVGLPRQRLQHRGQFIGHGDGQCVARLRAVEPDREYLARGFEQEILYSG